MEEPEVGSAFCTSYVWKSRRVVIPHGFYLPAETTETVKHYRDHPKETRHGLSFSADDGLLVRTQEATDSILKRCHPGVQHVFKKELGFHTFTAIQFAVIPLLLENPEMPSSDVIFTAATGQGKTLCYVIPIMTQLYNRVVPEIAALILAPTRELVSQIAEVFSVFCQAWQAEKIRSTVVAPAARVAVLGGSTTSFAAEAAELHGTKQTGEFSQAEGVCLPCMQPDAFWTPPPAPADIVVATPGRFVEHLCATGGSKTAAVLRSVGDTCASCFEPTLDIWSSLRWIVLDEADRLLDQKYQNWPVELSRLARYCSVPPQKVIASATMTTNPGKLSVLELDRPLVISLSLAEDSYAVPPDLKHQWIGCPSLTLSSQNLTLGSYKVRSKPLVLLDFLECVYGAALAQRPKTLIFTSTKERALRLTALINFHFNEERRGLGEVAQRACHAPFHLGAQVFTASMSQNDRAKVIRQFEKRHLSSSNGPPLLDVLVCSDVLARGLDIPGLDYVVNYDPPTHLKTYIHRAGRTGRAGKTGTTVTLLTRQELPRFRRLMKANRLPPSGSLEEWSKRQAAEEAREAATNETCVGTSLWDIVFRQRIRWPRIMQWVEKKQTEGSDEAVVGSSDAITLEEKEWSGESDDDNSVDGNGQPKKDKEEDHDHGGATEAEMEGVVVEVLDSEEPALDGSSYFELLLKNLPRENA